MSGSRHGLRPAWGPPLKTAGRPGAAILMMGAPVGAAESTRHIIFLYEFWWERGFSITFAMNGAAGAIHDYELVTLWRHPPKRWIATSAP